jgi:hypothetical protein
VVRAADPGLCHARTGRLAVAACSTANLMRGCGAWSFGSCTISSLWSGSCISVGPLPASTSSSRAEPAIAAPGTGAGVILVVERTTHHVQLSAAGAAFLIEAAADSRPCRSGGGGRAAGRPFPPPSLRVGSSTPATARCRLILHQLQQQYLDLEIWRSTRWRSVCRSSSNAWWTGRSTWGSAGLAGPPPWPPSCSGWAARRTRRQEPRLGDAAGGCSPCWRADRDQGVLSAFVMSRAPIRSFPGRPGAVS